MRNNDETQKNLKVGAIIRVIMPSRLPTASANLVILGNATTATAPATLPETASQRRSPPNDNNNNSSDNSGGNNSNSNSNNRKGSRKYPPCSTCKKTNHPEDRCFYKKIYEKAKAALAAEAKTTNAQTWGTSPDLSL